MEKLIQLALFALPIVGLGVVVLTALMLRRVVPTNEVHIVQSGKQTTSFGKDTGNGNSYYEWPSFLPVIGVTMTKMSMSVFDIDLTNYEAYDLGRLPFLVDVKAFFRVTDSNVAAQRVSSHAELINQLKAIVQGAVRVVLASHPIEEILQGRSKFGDDFTKEVAEQLKNWGVQTVKNIELMDLRDTKDSHVIKAIMDKKKSQIDMESRTEVAKNQQAATIAETNAKCETDLQQQQAKQAVGMRTLETEQSIELQKQANTQAVKVAQKNTREREMEVLRVEQTRAAEIEREVAVTKAEQAKQTTVLMAEAKLEAKRREAEGVTVEGQAHADAAKAMQLAPVQAQIVLAKEIGDNASYQNYLITLRKIESEQAIGIQQAEALKSAQIKVIASAGGPSEGVKNIMDMFTAKGGTQLGAMLEALAQSDEGQKVLNVLNVNKE